MSLKGKRQLKARMTALGEGRLILGRLAIAGVAEAKRLVPRRTGNLGRTIRVGTVTNDRAEVIAGGQRNVGYAAAVEFGTRPHVIVPRKKKALAWGGERTLGGRLRSGGKPTHFAKRVNHPGTRAKPYLRPGIIKAVEKQGGEIIVDIWNGAA